MSEPTQSHFFAHLFRMKLINRWPLMRNVNIENVAEHSHQVALVAHMLALVGQLKFNSQISPERVATLALYHDASEVLTGDLPTPPRALDCLTYISHCAHWESRNWHAP